MKPVDRPAYSTVLRRYFSRGVFSNTAAKFSGCHVRGQMSEVKVWSLVMKAVRARKTTGATNMNDRAMATLCLATKTSARFTGHLRRTP
jgi:hypothetical protein